VGTGPFKFVEWVRNSRFVVERNPDYWQKGKPYLDRVVFRGMQNTETREAAFKSGQTDIIIQPTMHFISTMKSDKRYDVYFPAGFGTEGVYMNLKKPPLDDIRVRRAVAHAMDRDLLNRTLGFGISTPAYSPFGKGMSMITQPVADYRSSTWRRPRRWSRSRQAGRVLAQLQQHAVDPPSRAVAAGDVGESRHQGAARGVRPEPSGAEHVEQAVRGLDLPLHGPGGSAYQRVHVLPFPVRTDQPVAELRRIRQQARRRAAGARHDHGRSAKRAAIYSEFAKVLNSEVLPYAYLFNVSDTIVAKKHVKGLTVVPDGLVRFADMHRQ
jgi:ABC-type transport system substrate-binding protein